MTAAEILRNAQPPADDALIEKAIADLDNKIWEWTDALKSAHAQLRGAFAVRPPAPRPSAALYDAPPPASSGAAPNLQAAAAAAHIAAPPPMPAEWTAPPPAPSPQWAPSHGGHGAANNNPASNQASAPATNWAQPTGPDFQQPGGAASPGVMQWPSTPSNAWPDSTTAATSSGAQSWPTWTPTDNSPSAGSSGQEKKAGSMPSQRSAKSKGPKAAPLQGPSAEERVQKAAAEEALLSELEEAIARRVRLLRRLDPDTAIEKLIEKAKLGHAESLAAGPAKDDKASSSWWRRK